MANAITVTNTNNERISPTYDKSVKLNMKLKARGNILNLSRTNE